MLVEGGQAKVEAGINLGIGCPPPMLKKGWSKISSILRRLLGSRTSIALMSDLACSDTYTASGNSYSMLRIFL